ncbi:hypothetical protein CW304_22355 [Bacillus sp. UFRGS-B20]|nr:hypothetical protein CW304_22355 [Bacillus sp. UFRGS-B20]
MFSAPTIAAARNKSLTRISGFDFLQGWNGSSATYCFFQLKSRLAFEHTNQQVPFFICRVYRNNFVFC